MIADPGHQFNPVGELHHIIICPQGKCVRLGFRFFLGRQHDQGHVLELLMHPEEFHQGQPVYFRHDQILKDDRWLEFGGGRDGLRGVLAKLKDNILFRLQHSLHRRADNGLIVNEENLDLVLGQSGRRIPMGTLCFLFCHKKCSFI